MMDIPYWSMVPAFTQGGKERENLSALARSCAGVGSALIQIFTMTIVYILGRIGASGEIANSVVELNGFRYLAIAVAVIFIAFTLICCINIKEKSTVNMQTASLGQMFKALIQNDQAMVIVIAIVCVNTAFYTTSNLLIYFFKYDFGGENWYNSYTLFNTFGGGMQILSMMLLFPLLRKFFNTIKLFKISLTSAILGYVVLLIISFFSMSNVFILFIPAFFIFTALGILTVLTTIFLANTVDYGHVKNGRRDESVIFSMQTFVVKLASGISALIASICLYVFSISSNTDTEVVASLSQTSVTGLRMTMTILPMLGLFIAMYVFRHKYILTDEKIKELETEIKNRGLND